MFVLRQYAKYLVCTFVLLWPSGQAITRQGPMSISPFGHLTQYKTPTILPTAPVIDALTDYPCYRANGVRDSVALDSSNNG